MGGRKAQPSKVLRVRYRNTDNGSRKVRSRLVFGSSKRAKRLFKSGKVLRINKVTNEELMHVGEHSPLNISGRDLERMLSAERAVTLSPEEVDKYVRAGVREPG